MTAALEVDMRQEGLLLEPPREDLDWSSLKFSHMFPNFGHWRHCISAGTDGAKWSARGSIPHEPLKLEPSAGALNYGRTILQGIKACSFPT